MADNRMRQWTLAEMRFQEKGMSKGEIEEHKKAWFKKRKPAGAGSDLRRALGTGAARQAGEALYSRRKREEGIK